MPREIYAPVKVAAVQKPPVFLDREATIDMACETIAEAARNEARLIVFPEAFVPAYPDWVWAVPAGEADTLGALYAELLENSVEIPDESVSRLCSAAADCGAHVVIGVNERNVGASGASLYNTLLFIGGRGEVLGRHRKLMPTGGERIVWDRGDGSSLVTYDTPFGKLGGLICWENYMPLARYALFAQGLDVYVASTWDRSDVWLATLRHIAREGRAYVIGSCMALRREHIPDLHGLREWYPEDEFDWINVGNSAIVDPEGEFVAGPLERQEGILYAEVDPRKVRRSRWEFDVAGHYSRPDVLQLTVVRESRPVITYADSRERKQGARDDTA